MAHAVSARVPFTAANVSQCMCPECPVESRSRCSSGKLARLDESLKKKPLQAEAIPALYCATGVAACTDLDQKQPCICPSCAVFGEYKLAGGQPPMRYCKGGQAR